MLSKLKDHHIRALLLNGKRSGAYPFLRQPHAMIVLRKDAASRGIYASKNEEERAVREVTARMEDDKGVRLVNPMANRRHA